MTTFKPVGKPTRTSRSGRTIERTTRIYDDYVVKIWDRKQHKVSQVGKSRRTSDGVTFVDLGKLRSLPVVRPRGSKAATMKVAATWSSPTWRWASGTFYPVLPTQVG